MSTTDFTVDRDTIIKGALRLCGVLAQGETPNSTQITEAAEALNLMVKAWQVDGMPLWAIKKISIPLTYNQAIYTIGVGEEVDTAKPLKVIQAYLTDVSGHVDIPMRIITQQEYNILGNKTSTGQPVQLYYQPLNDTGVLSLFPVPDTVSSTNKQVVILYQRPFDDFDSSTDTPDFPQEWHEAIKYGLAVRLAGDYQIDLETRRTLSNEAAQIHELAKSFGTEEGSLYFGADQRRY